MNPNLLNIAERKKFLEHFRSDAQKKRKQEAFVRYDVFKDNLYPYVHAYLSSQFDADTVKSMPIVSSINIAKRVILQEASIYAQDPVRNFSNGGTKDDETMALVIKDARLNAKMKKANEYFKLQKGQIVVQVIIKDKKVQTRVLLPHQFDVIPDFENPEVAFAYLVCTSGRMEKPADERFTLWTKDLNMNIDGAGNILGDAAKVTNPIGILPFADISVDKDSCFWVKAGDTDVDFTIQYNAALSDLWNICRLQAYAQGVYIGDIKSMPTVVRTGPNRIIRIPVNPDAPGVANDFKFVSPNPNIDGVIKQIEQLLANFLTTRGVDAKVIQGTLSGDTGYSSGIERLLAMIDRFEATRDDFAVFEVGEMEIFEIAKKWLEVYSGTDLLDPKYRVTSGIKNLTMALSFSKPESIKTDEEKNTDLEFRIKHGVADQVTILMERYGFTEEQALEELKRIYERKGKIEEMKPKEVVDAELAEKAKLNPEVKDDGKGSKAFPS